MKIKVSTIVITSIVVTSAVAGGLALGIVLGKALSPKVPVAPTGKIDTGIEDDYAALMEKYENDKNVESYRPYELANISWLKFGQLEHTHTVSLGTVTASVATQKIFAHDVRDGDRLFTESLSAGMKKVGVRFYQENGVVKSYTASKVKDNGTASYSEDDSIARNLESHEEVWGKTLDRPVIYNISSKTVLNETLTEVDGKYVVNLELDPVTSVSRYVRQMVNISSLDRYPDFKYVKLQFTMDKELNIEELKTDEHYVVYVIGTNDSKGTLTQKFYRESSETIPSLEESYHY